MLMFLQAVGEAVLAKGLDALKGFVPFGNVVYEIGGDAVNRYRQARREAKIVADAEAVLKAEMQLVRADAVQIIRAEVKKLAEPLSDEIADLAVAYLTQMPGAIRQSLKRADDPSGTTIPAALNLADPVQFGSLLPRRLPTFRAGDAVPHAPQWRFVELLGAGGFGEVWLAKHAYLDDLRAFKFCLDPAARHRLLTHEKDVVRRVMKASAAVSDTDHGIVRLLDCYLEEDGPWLAYEYIDGGDLSAWARANALLAPPVRAANALGIVRDLAAVVGHFHALPQPVIHRDLKPANVLLKQVNGRWLLRVTDFGIGHVGASAGIARATVSTPSMSLGDTFRGAHTPNYASPQQKKGGPADPRDDVHALGIIALQLLLGDLTAERPSGNSWKKKLKDCDVPADVLDLLGRCWDDDPDERPKDAAEVRAALAGAPGSAVPPAVAPVRRRAERVPDLDPEPIPLVPAPPARQELLVAAEGRGRYREIADAVAAAAPGALIRVTPGTYRKPVLLNREVEIVGDGPRERVVLETVDANCIEARSGTAVVRGLTMRVKDGGTNAQRCAVFVLGGTPLFEDCVIASELLSCAEVSGRNAAPRMRSCTLSGSRHGSGLHIRDGAGGVYEGCTLTGNALSGILIIGAGTAPTVRGCTADDNRDNGILALDGGGGLVEGSRFRRNGLYGAEVKGTDAAPTFRDCVFEGSQCGARVHAAARPTFERCALANNQTSAAQFQDSATAPVLRDCRLTDTAAGAGVLIFAGAAGLFDGCEVSGNKLHGLEVKGAGTVATVRGGQVRRNGGDGIWVYGQASATVDGCDLRGNGGKPLDAERGCAVTERNNRR